MTSHAPCTQVVTATVCGMALAAAMISILDEVIPSDQRKGAITPLLKIL
jgi:hypothetical protein